MIEYLGKIKTEFETTLACLSRTQIGSNHEKNEGRKSRDTLPLNSSKCNLEGIVSLDFEGLKTTYLMAKETVPD